MTSVVRSGRSRSAAVEAPGPGPTEGSVTGPGGASVVLVCGPGGSVIVDGVAAGLARHRGEVVGESVRVVALDGDVADARLAEQVRRAHAVVHVARDPSEDLRAARDREGSVTESAERLFAAIAKSDVTRLVVVTSAVLFGPHPDNPLPLAEDHVAAEPPPAGLAAALQSVESAAQALLSRRPDLRLTVLRPAALVAPGIDGDVTRHFAAPRLLGLRGIPMAWQFCHVDDLASAVALVLDSAESTSAAHDVLPTVMAVGAPGWLTDADVEAVCGKRRIDLPPTLVFGTADRLQRIGATVSGSVPALVYPWVVEPTRLSAAGWRPRYDNAAALEALLVEARDVLHHVARRRGREAAGAAGATVAALGTALVVRRARRRRRQG